MTRYVEPQQALPFVDTLDRDPDQLSFTDDPDDYNPLNQNGA